MTELHAPAAPGNAKDVILVGAAVLTVVVGVLALRQHQAGATAGLTPTGGVTYTGTGGGGGDTSGQPVGVSASDMAAALKALQAQFTDALTAQGETDAKGLAALQAGTQTGFDTLTANINGALKTLVGQEQTDSAAAQTGIAAVTQSLKDQVTALLTREQQDITGLQTATNAALKDQATQTGGLFASLQAALQQTFGNISGQLSTLGGQVATQGQQITGLTSGLSTLGNTVGTLGTSVGSINDWINGLNRVSIQGSTVLTTDTSGGSWGHGFTTGTGYHS